MLRNSHRNKFSLLFTTLFFGLLSGALKADDHFPERTPTFPSSTAKSAGTPTIMLAAGDTAQDLATAMDIPVDSIVSASLDASDPRGAHIFTSSLGEFPVKGSSFAALSSGEAITASLPNTSSSLSQILGGLNNSQGNDLVQFTVTLTVPVGAKFWAVDWKFLSEEFAEFVGSSFNDAFFIETPDTNITIVGNVASSENNVALDSFGSRVSINTTGATGMTVANAAGTTYDGATTTLTTANQIPEGTSQITIVFSVTDLGDSVYDTTVFLDNFRFLTKYVAPPKLNPPGNKVIIPKDPIALDKPTVVLTHGLSAMGDLDGAPNTLWIGNFEKQAAALIKDEISGSVNIFTYTWENGFTMIDYPHADFYKAAQAYVYDAGENLAKELLKPENLGPTYNGKIHFIGHSLGTIVNAYAARAFLEKATNVKSAQFTALDRPDHVITNIPFCWIPPVCKGYDENFFGEILQKIQTKPGRGLNLVIDNYYSREGAGVGDETNGLNVYNHEKLINPNDLDDSIFDDEGIDNNHSGVHQWYRWTINPNGLYDLFNVCHSQTGELLNLPLFFDESLDPCNKGWKWSIVRTNPLPFPKTKNKPVVTKESSLSLTDYQDYGCTLSNSSNINCEEKSSPFGIAEVNIPEDATALSFKYRFTNVGDGDYAAVYLDNILIWTFAGSSYLGEDGEFTDSGPLPIGDLTGKRSLTVILYGVGQKNAQFEIQDIKTLTMSTSLEVAIDIHPGSFPNSINPRSRGVIPVAILTVDTFDATQVDPLSVKFGVGGAMETHRRGHIEDANGDGRMDLVLHFATQESRIQCGDTSASLTGSTFVGQAILGSDSIKTVGCQ